MHQDENGDLKMLAAIASRSPRKSCESPTKKTKLAESPPQRKRGGHIKQPKRTCQGRSQRRVLFSPESGKIVASMHLVHLSANGDLSINITLPTHPGPPFAFSVGPIKFMSVDHQKGGKSRTVFDSSFQASSTRESDSGEIIVEGVTYLGKALGKLMKEWARERRKNVMVVVVISQSTTVGPCVQETVARCLSFDDLRPA